MFCERCRVLRLPADLVALAGRQEGVLQRQQLVAHGVPEGVIRGCLREGRWQRWYDGVYVTFSGPIPRLTQIWAAVLVAGEWAVASHETAAELWGLVDHPVASLHVGVPNAVRIWSRPGLLVHRARQLDAHPAAAPRRTRVEATVLDLVNTAESFDQVVSWVTRACQRRRTTADRLRIAAARRPRMCWRSEFRDLIADVRDGAETPLELAYVRRVERPHGLPPGKRQRHRNVAASTQWIDVDYRGFRTRVELDGRVGHVEEGAHRDHARDNVSTVEQHATLRFGWIDVHDSPCEAAIQVATVLGHHGRRDTLRPCGPSCRAIRPQAA